MGAESGGVVGMLEVIQSDFARLETDTKAAEAQAQSEFDKFSSESAVNRAEKAKDVEHKTTKKTNQESALTSKKADLEGTQKELDAALAYYYGNLDAVPFTEYDLLGMLPLYSASVHNEYAPHQRTILFTFQLSCPKKTP